MRLKKKKKKKKNKKTHNKWYKLKFRFCFFWHVFDVGWLNARTNTNSTDGQKRKFPLGECYPFSHLSAFNDIILFATIIRISLDFSIEETPMAPSGINYSSTLCF